MAPSGAHRGSTGRHKSVAAIADTVFGSPGPWADIVVASTGIGTYTDFNTGCGAGASPLPSLWYLLNGTAQGGLYFCAYANYDQPGAQVGLIPSSMAIADIDGDGNADIVVANKSDNSISVLFGDDSGDLYATPLTGGPPLVPLEFWNRPRARFCGVGKP